MSKYAELDEAIVKAIANGCNKFFRLELWSRSLSLVSKDWRLLDRRLQALRKAGRIEFVGGYWQVKKP